MSKLLNAQFIKIETTEEMDALKHALEVQIDIENDMVWDELPMNVHEIRRLAEMDNDMMRRELGQMMKNFDERSDRLEATQQLLLRL